MGRRMVAERGLLGWERRKLGREANCEFTVRQTSQENMQENMLSSVSILSKLKKHVCRHEI
jgi:hypothetical protein